VVRFLRLLLFCIAFFLSCSCPVLSCPVLLFIFPFCRLVLGSYHPLALVVYSCRASRCLTSPCAVLACSLRRPAAVFLFWPLGLTRVICSRLFCFFTLCVSFVCVFFFANVRAYGTPPS
ncbi:unnamed protein product, partial [Sphacelaria rigidula]